MRWHFWWDTSNSKALSFLESIHFPAGSSIFQHLSTSFSRCGSTTTSSPRWDQLPYLWGFQSQPHHHVWWGMWRLARKWHLRAVFWYVLFCFFWGGHPKQPKSNWICVNRFQSLNMFKHENKLRKQHTYLRNLTFRSESKDAERVGMSLSTGMGSQSFMDFTLNTLYERTLLWVFGCF